MNIHHRSLHPVTSTARFRHLARYLRPFASPTLKLTLPYRSFPRRLLRTPPCSLLLSRPQTRSLLSLAWIGRYRSSILAIALQRSLSLFDSHYRSRSQRTSKRRRRPGVRL